MQIMNLKKLVKDLWWALTASRTINDLPDAIIFIDSEGFVKRANKRAFECFGIKIDETNLIKLEDFIKDGMSVVNSSIIAQKSVPAVAVIPGREFYVELNASKKGRGYCLAIRDVTKLTNEILTEDKIARFNGEKNAMLVKLEGEIKSPITSITGFSQGLLDGLGGELSEKQAKYIKIINSNSNDLYHFVDKLLEFTYAESSLYEADYQKFDIVEAFKAIIKDFEPEIEEKKLCFDFDYEGILKRTVYTDLKAIQRVFRNILEVALSMTDSGYILVKLAPTDDKTALRFGLNPEDLNKSYLQISIKDTGIGVPPEEMKYLCEPYAQLEKGKKNFLRALKLGSASILTKRASGYINVRSEVMQGTKYYIIIPTEKE